MDKTAIIAGSNYLQLLIFFNALLNMSFQLQSFMLDILEVTKWINPTIWC